MLVHEVKAFRYYSDFTNFDIVVVLEGSTDKDVRQLLDDIIEDWFRFDENYEKYYQPIGDFIEQELKHYGIMASLYFGGCDDED